MAAVVVGSRLGPQGDECAICTSAHRALV